MYSSKSFAKYLNEKQRTYSTKKKVKKLKQHLYLGISAVYIVDAVYVRIKSSSDCLHGKLINTHCEKEKYS